MGRLVEAAVNISLLIFAILFVKNVSQHNASDYSIFLNFIITG
jgi:hypothetical protein